MLKAFLLPQKKIVKERRLNKLEKFIYGAVYFIGILGPIMTIPQIMEIWVGKNAAGVSAISWGAYAAIESFWIIYGIVDRDKPIIFIYSMWVIIDIFVMIGAIIYN